jgi:hypothetical protein
VEDAIGKWAFGEEMVNLAMNDTLIQKYGWCATTDAATVHGEPIMVYSAMRPTQPAPLLLKFANGSKAVSLKGGKGAPEEADAFLEKLKNTRGGGRCCLVLCTDVGEAKDRLDRVANGKRQLLRGARVRPHPRRQDGSDQAHRLQARSHPHGPHQRRPTRASTRA